MTSLARLSFKLPIDQLDEFEDVYQRRLASILQKHDLTESPEPGRPTADGILSRLFEVESPKTAVALKRALRKDPAWCRALQDLPLRLTGTPPCPDFHFGIYSTSAGPGKVAEMGPGFRRGQWQTFGIQDGFPVHITYDALTDRNGNLWFATHEGGVCRYDGARTTTFTREDGLAGDVASSILQDRDGNLWFGTWWSGVSRYDGEQFQNFTTADGLVSDTISCILEDRRGNLWFGSGGFYDIEGAGVSRYDGERFQNFTTADGLVSDTISCILEDRRGNLWFGSGGLRQQGSGVSCYDGDGFRTFTARDGLASDTISCILEDRNGNLWFGSGDGLCRYNGKEFFTFTEKDDLVWPQPLSMMEDREGCLWFGTRQGLSRYDGKWFQNFTTEDGLANDQVVSMTEDREGHLWFGTWSGISRYDPVHCVTYTIANGLPSNGVMRVAEDHQNDLWVSTWRGVCCFDGWRFVPVEELSDFNAWIILEDRQGRLWFSSHDGEICHFDGTDFTTLTREAGLAPEVVMSIAEDHRGNLWFGSEKKGIRRYDGSSFTSITAADGLADDTVDTILVDRRGDLWFGTYYGGVSRYDGENFHTFTTADGLTSDTVYTIIEDRQGRLWFGTGDGVCFYDGERFRSLPVQRSVGNDEVFSILEDQQGHLWFGSYGGGICRYDGLVLQTLSRRDGLAHDAVQQIYQDRGGDYWIATEGGLTRYRPSPLPPVVRIVQVTADRRYAPDETICLPASQRLSTFSFQGSSYTTPPACLAYVYKLKGSHEDWRPVYVNQVSYEDLPLGEYTFQVRAVDRDLNYSEPASLSFVVAPDPRLQALTEALSDTAGEFVGESGALRRVQEQLAQVAPADMTVLILGETGTGKGLAARTVHALSQRHAGPLIQVNCGAIPAGLVESELFGHEKGAFTGAHDRRLGRIEVAGGGTLFLDEIGDMSTETQTRLLRLLEEGTFERVGGSRTLTADVRVVAATNRNLKQMIADGEFRQDLYFRLRVFEVRLPSLRKRREDIPQLAAYFAERMANHLDKPITHLEPATLERLALHDWPGNVRELEHTIQRAVIVTPGPTIRIADLSLDPDRIASEPPDLVSLEEHERRYLRQVLEHTDGRISGPRGAAAILGIPESTLRFRMKKLGLRRS